MGIKDKALLLFQLGPVQKFIAQAETVGDLKAGSELLSELTAAALKCVPDWDVQGESSAMVFPAVGNSSDLKGIPNRFLAFVPKGEAESIAGRAVAAARAELRRIAEEAWPKLHLPEMRRKAYEDQVEQFLQTSWAILKNPTGVMGDDYATIGKQMAMRRNVRHFDAWHEVSDGAVKDFLSGKETALDIRDDRSNRDCGRGAMNLIKMSRRDADLKADAAKEFKGKYLAVIAMDGDHMGEKLSGFKTCAEHLDFSRRLAGFAAWLKGRDQDVIPADGYLVYAGGDDVLAVVKATDALGVAQRLASKFVAQLTNPGEKTVTASVGIAIGSVKVPLQDLVHAAHAAENRAKHGYGRDALAVDIYKRSGEILKWGCKFGSAAFEIYDAMSDYGRRTGQKDTLSRFSYKLASFIEPYALKKGDLDGTMHEVVKAETLHSLEQTKESRAILPADLLERFLREESVKEHPEDYLGLFMCEAFINRPRN